MVSQLSHSVTRPGRVAAARRARRRALEDFRRTTLLDAARKTFARLGFARATMDDVARAAGIAKGTVYLYYKSKRQLYVAAVIKGMQELHQRVMNALEGAASLEDTVRAVLETRVRYIQQHEDFFRIYHAELGNTASAVAEVRQEQARLYLEQVDAIESALQRGRGAIGGVSPRIAAFSILDLSHGLVTRQLRGWSRPGTDEVGEVIALLWRGIGKP